TWVALKHVPDWRWQVDRADSPWYPTTRLFRQKVDRDWKSAFEDIESELWRVTAQGSIRSKLIEPPALPKVTYNAEHPSVNDAFDAGVAFHKAGRLDDAEATFRTVLADNAKHFGALHALGLIAQQRGNSTEALRFLDAALTINPTSAKALYDRAIVH